jgi:hypothetical protein
LTGNTVAALTITSATINGGTITGITDLAVADGGTGASNAATARTNLGAAPSADPAFTGQASFADGTAAAPSITNTGDLDAGLFFPAADTVAVATAGVEAMRITSAGNVGIGTSSANARLVCRATDPNYSLGLSGTTKGIRVSHNATQSSIQGVDSTLIGSFQPLSIGGSLVYFGTGGSERMRIDASGNVGIGTTAPAAKLEVALGANGEYMRVGGDDATNNRALRFTSSTTVGSVGALHTINASGSAGVIALATASTERMRIDASGNVGIGTSSPTANLQIGGVSGGDKTFQIGSAGATRAIMSTNGSLGTFTIGATNDSSAGTLVFQTGSALTERMRINELGNVGIGTNSPADKLQVEGNIYLGTTNRTIYSGGSANLSLQVNTGQLIFLRSNGANESMRIDADGDLGVGTSSPAARVHIVASGLAGQFRIQDVTTDATTKNGVVGGGHYTNAEEPFSGMLLRSAATDNKVDIGGGVSTMNAATSIVFSTAANTTTLTGTERMRIDSTGSVGIGTSSPTSNLQIYNANAAITTNEVAAAGSGVASTRLKYSTNHFGFYVGSANALVTYDYGAAAERMRINASGNVGIGTSSPDTLVTISASGVNGLNLSQDLGNSVLSSRLMLSNATAGQTAAILNNTGSLLFSTGATVNSSSGTERMRIDTSGNVGIGVTPAAWGAGKSLSVGGTGNHIWGSTANSLYVGSNTYYDTAFKYANTGAATTYQSSAGEHRWFNAPSGTAGTAITFTQAMTLDVSGNLGVGNTAPVTKLHVTGASMTTGVVYQAQPAQTSKAAAATLTIAELLTGIIQYTGAAATLTLPTGTLIEGGLPATFPTDMSFDVSFINTGAALLTIGTATSLTLVGTMTVATGTSGLLRFRKTATNTYTVYRIS